MVFGFDDVIEDGGILAIMTSIYYSLFPEAEVVVPEVASGVINILNDSQYLVIQDLLGDDGLEAVISIADGSTKSYEGLPAYERFYDLAESSYEIEINGGTTITNKEAFIQNVSKLASSISKKIPTTSAGFKTLLLDIIKGAINNPGKAVAIGSAGIGLAGLSYGVIKQIKESFDKGERLPDDVQKLIDDGKLTISDLKQTVSDTAQSILPKSLFG